MNLDLHSSTCPQAMDCDLCVIGAGTAGSYLLSRLAGTGLSVVALEAGSEGIASADELDFSAITEGETYGGLSEGRAFGLGGTSARWGGLLIPYGALDVDGAAPDTRPEWAHIVDVVSRSSETVRRAVGIRSTFHGDTEARTFLGRRSAQFAEAKLLPRVSEMMAFRSRNLARLLSSASRDPSTRVVTNAVVSGWSTAAVDGGVRVASVDAVSSNGNRMTCRARQFVVACGAIESARVLLELDRATDERALSGRRSIGCGFSDHLSIAIASVDGSRVPDVIQDFAPRFHGSVMRAVRWTAEGQTPRHFAHFAFSIDNPGFLLAKTMLSALQGRRLPKVTGDFLLQGAGGLGALAFHRLVRRRLHVPGTTPVTLQLDLEQEIDPANSIRLSRECDRYGRPRAVVRWRVSDQDKSNIGSLQQEVLRRWNMVPGFSGALRLVPPDSSGAKLHDAYHPVGTTRMGSSDSAVADLSLKVRGTDNVFALSTGIFPAAGSANPTFSLLCMAEELARRISSRKR